MFICSAIFLKIHKKSLEYFLTVEGWKGCSNPDTKSKCIQILTIIKIVARAKFMVLFFCPKMFCYSSLAMICLLFLFNCSRLGLKRNYELSISKQLFTAPLLVFVLICPLEYLLGVSVEWFTKKLSNIPFLKHHYHLKIFQLVKYMLF